MVFVLVLLVELIFIRAIGTDIPFHDQWNAEGQWLYPGWQDGSLRAAEFFRPWNEHRIAWTHLLNLGLFVLNGQWDPLVQLVAIALLRAGCAAGLAVWAARHLAANRAIVAAVITIAFLPHLAWHSVLWGFESQVYFCVGFSLLCLAMLGTPSGSLSSPVAAVVFGGCALLAMGGAALVPVALAVLVAVRWRERHIGKRELMSQTVAVAALLALAWFARVTVPENTDLRAANAREFAMSLARVLAWPHVNAPAAAIVMNLPIVIVFARRLRRGRPAAPGEDFVLALAAWSAALAAAIAWARGGSDELARGVPSRYVDFVVLLPLANVWGAWTLTRETSAAVRSRVCIAATIWTVFLVAGWCGLTAEVVRGLVRPRMADREAPIRLIRQFQLSGDPTVFSGAPRLLVPHPQLEIVRSVLVDPRLGGALPPSLQPERPPGPLSRGVRATLHQH